METLTEIWGHLNNFYKSISVLILAFACYTLCRSFIIKKLQSLAASTANDLDDRLVYFVKQFLGIFALFCIATLLLKINGIHISPLLAGAGIVGVSLGFAAKETIADVLAGIFLIADQPIRIGDRVKIEKIGSHWGGWGDVVDIGLRRTRIKNTDGVYINYPNALLANSVITNFSYQKSPVRVRIRFQVDYDADLNLTKQITNDAVASCHGVLPDTAQTIIRSLDDSQGNMLTGILVEARYRIEDVRKRTTIRSEVLQKILEELRAHNIPIATPKMRLEREHHWVETYLK
ncbi:MAG: mechanosensitive ion channel family protein [Desulfobulbaceae bacterium]|nr:mechanosensitive ion channel family protein [Desulfobulbaceae bacterium]